MLLKITKVLDCVKYIYILLPGVSKNRLTMHPHKIAIQFFTLGFTKNVQSFSKEQYSCVDIADVMILTDIVEI